MKLTEKSLCAILAVILPQYDKEPNDTLLSGFWAVLGGQEEEAVKGAFFAHLGDSDRGRFAPKPADIVHQIEQARGTEEDAAVIAWSAIRRAIPLLGAYRSIRCVTADGSVDFAAHAAILALGGWAAVCKTDSEDMGYRQREFLAFYRAELRRPSERRPHLVSLTEESGQLTLGDDRTPWPILTGGGEALPSRPAIAAPRPALTEAERAAAPDPRALQAEFAQGGMRALAAWVGSGRHG